MCFRQRVAQSDKKKYEKARMLKGDDEADTVGCCTLKVENVKAIAPNKLEFNFLGKDSIRYENTVEVELPVYNAVIKFQSGEKKGNDDLFDLLDSSKLNAHLKELMPGLTAKVFCTYNASIALDDMQWQLNRETKDGDLEGKKTVYNTANKQDVLQELKVDIERARKGKPPLKDGDGKTERNLSPEALEKKINKMNANIAKIKWDMQNKEDTKTVALDTSKTNYLDPRITAAWCKRHEVPIEKGHSGHHLTTKRILSFCLYGGKESIILAKEE
ncbi:DNA topoisomerase I [Parasponia andersonii]|uniref:DNA topoisomerase n=1 Tax=Parasponia andersonii TaxID=3476 RepID=A0A2P5AW09_PARAD|nr:DNA topoisomerase I [Parasponia andersonii]